MYKTRWAGELKRRMKVGLKTQVESWLWTVGLDVQIRRAQRGFKTRDEREYQWLRELEPRTILDIGAHTGAYSCKFRQLFPTAQIYSFEPVAQSYEELVKCMKDDRRFKAFNYALSDFEGEATFHQSEASETSSLLAMGEIHKRAYPHAAATWTTRVQTRRLDDLADELKLITPIFAKIDVQGGEVGVIRGGVEILRRAEVVILETGFVELYDNQPMFGESYEMMQQLDFAYAGSFNQLLHPANKRVLQQDAIFVRRQAFRPVDH